MEDLGSMEGVVCEWEPNRCFAHTWGLAVVKWELEEDSRGTNLCFTNSHAMSDIVIGFAAGWHAFIDHLGPHLSGESVEDRYDEVVKLYEGHYSNLHVSNPE